MSTSTARRFGAAVLGGSLLVAGLTIGAAPAHAHDEKDRTAKAIGAGWLIGRLDDGLLHAAYADFVTGDPVPYVDYGGTVEAAYALDAVGRTRLLPRITGALEDSVDSYITGADFGSPDDYYAGPTGKLLSLVADLGGAADPTSFGGQDLVTLMEGMTADEGAETGRIADAAATDYANVFGQIWAAHGLLAVDSAEAPAAVDYLLSTQCGDGFFPTYFDDSCDPASAGPDATAFAIILLSDAAESDPDLAAALDSATAWLVDWQARNGSFADDNGVANANSTGLSGWALGLEGRERAATKAAVWLRSLQVPGRGCDGKLARQRGAVAYDKAAYKKGQAKGINRLAAGEWQTVGAQALPALAHAPASHYPFQVAAPAHLRAGGQAGVQVAGLAPGERACVGIAHHLRPVVGRRDGLPSQVRIDVPAKKGPVVVKLLAANRIATDTAVVR
jgi:hypothetical protein